MSVIPSLAVVKAVSYCMQPLVRLCIRHGIDYRQLSEILKGTFVTVAEQDFHLPGRKQTDSRVSLITGVHRKDVHRLRHEEEQGGTKLPLAQRLATSIVAFWLSTPELLNAEKQPTPVPRTPREGYPWCFAQMLAQFNQDMPARALLDEMVSQGVLRVDHDDLIHLVPEAMVPSKNLDQKAAAFSTSIHDHIAAAGENLSGLTPSFFDSHLSYMGLTEEDAARLGLIAERAANKAFRTVSESALEIKQSALAAGRTGSIRVHFGAFFYKTAQSDSEAESQAGSLPAKTQ